MRIIKVELDKLDKTVLNIGWEGEQNHVQVQIQCGAFFAKYPNAGAGLTVLSPSNVTYPVVLDKEGNDLIWDIDASDVVNAGSGKIQLTFTDGTGDDAEVIKTVIGSFNVNASLAVDGEAPDPIANWIDEANATLAEFENEIEDIDKITEATAADEGKALTAKTVTGGKVTEWEYVDVADPDVIEAAVDDWLDDHPEATTTVQDGSITEVKLHEDLSAELARVDGYYAEMTVGDAEQLVATQYVNDKTPYLFRTSGGSADIGNREYPQKIVGGSVALNQFADNTATSGNHYAETWASTLDIQNGTIKAITTRNDNYMGFNFVNKNILFAKDHKYLMLINVKEVSFTATYVGLDIRDDWSSLPSASHTITYTGAGSYGVIVNSAASGTPGKNQRMIVRIEGTSEIGDYVTINGAMLIDLTQMFGRAIADAVYAMEQATEGTGVAWFRSLFPDSYYAYNEGELMHVSGLSSHDMVGFNAWDEEWEGGSINGGNGQNAENNTKIRSKGYIPVLPNTNYYFLHQTVAVGGADLFMYDANKTYLGYYNYSVHESKSITTPAKARFMRFVILGTTYNHDICINLSWSGWRNGEYEPYEKHSYPLDSDLTLRGIPKIDASGHLYYDGDEYLPDGSVNRKYGIVDLGTLTYSVADQSGAFYSSITNMLNPATNALRRQGIISSIYPVASDSALSASMDNKSILRANGNIYIKDTSYNDATAFKTAMSGVYLVYELATPTTESADPYNPIQWVDDFGTEEYISTTIVPVGHETNYPANLRDKIQHLPDLADTDGKYVITQSDKQMSLTPVENELPTLPSEDGTYTLKVTVSGSTKTLSWVADT